MPAGQQREVLEAACTIKKSLETLHIFCDAHF